MPKDTVLADYKIYFADLHFHTNYSDNKDKATIEDMLLMGSKNDISIFGTADHNHNLNTKKWKALVEQTENLRSKYPDYLIMNNCEITFLMGHFVIVNPPTIMGTIEEGYSYLYKQKEIIKILAHPNPDTDEWYAKIIPYVSAIEVINGSVFQKAISDGYQFRTALDIPMLRLYSEYIAMGYPVAAIGNSDAHTLSEMGSGMTGLYLPDKFDLVDVFSAIKSRTTFATTDPGIKLQCTIDNSLQEFNWEISWKPKKKVSVEKYVIEVYNCSNRLVRTKNNGKVKIEQDGIYWIAVFNKENLAVSSPLSPNRTELKSQCLGKIGFQKKEEKYKVEKKLKNTFKDIYWFELHENPIFNFFPIKKRGKTEIEIYSSNRNPLITDALGNNVKYQIVAPVKYKTVIDKQCNSPCFDEFYIWLKRNEIHECMFLDIDYKKNGNLFLFNALLIPAKMVFINNFGERYKNILPDIKKLIYPKTRFILKVRTLYKLLVQTDMADFYFPLEIDKNKLGYHNYLFWINHDYASYHRFLKSLCINDDILKTRIKAWDNIFQIFM